MSGNKALLPSLREKKRYLAFEIISKGKISGFSAISTAINESALDYLGTKGAAVAGIILLKERYDPQRQRGIIRVNHKNVDHLRASLCFVESIGEGPVIVHSIGTSGILKKAYNKYIAN